MRKDELSKELLDEANFLIRFLKENGVYYRYKKYLNTERVKNITKFYKDLKGCNIFSVICYYGTTEDIISKMVVWNKTDEGYVFWYNLNRRYCHALSGYKTSGKEKAKA